MPPHDLGTHDLEKLTQAHGELPKPKAAYLDALSATLEAVEKSVPAIRLGPIQGPLRRWADDERFAAAAWRWLRPQQDPDLHKSLESLRQRLKLTHHHEREFLNKLTNACTNIQERHPKLKSHVAARIAEIEYALRKDDTETLGEAFSVGILQLVNATDQRREDPDAARDAAEAVIRNTLAGICKQVAAVLDPTPQAERVMNANLMVPISFTAMETFRASMASGFSGEAHDLGWQLWDGFDRWKPHQVFVAVAETAQGPGFEGFWVPDIRHNGVPLPGAPRAYLTGEVQRLVQSDLPGFPVPDEDMRDRWLSYMRGAKKGTFTSTFCVSIPIKARQAVENVAQPVAVVNVNVHLNGPVWGRVLSRSWRNLVAKRVEPLGAVLWPALGIKYLTARSLLSENNEGSAALMLPTQPPDVGNLVAPAAPLRLSSGRFKVAKGSDE